MSTSEKVERKHSLAPWMVGSRYSDAQDEIECADGKCIAVVWTRTTWAEGKYVPSPCYKESPEGVANAFLIAAAPELLAALKAMLHEFKDYSDDNSGRAPKCI